MLRSVNGFLIDPQGIPMHSNELQTGYRRYHETLLPEVPGGGGITSEGRMGMMG